MIEISDIIDIAFKNLNRLYDTENGGFYYSIDKNNQINKTKLLRYNTRIINLLYSNSKEEYNMLYRTSKYLVSNLHKPDGSIYYSSLKDKLANIGDVALFITALNKFTVFDNFLNVSVSWLQQNLNSVRHLDSSQIPWLLSVLNDKNILNYFLNERKMLNKRFYFSYIDFPTIVYTIHYFVETNLIENAHNLCLFLINKMLSKSGEWKLAYFPFLKWRYSKPFSVHQLGMAPTYLLELYGVINDEKILESVKKGIEFGKRFIGKDRIYRTFYNKETRSYECAFDYVGLTKAKEYGVI